MCSSSVVFPLWRVGGEPTRTNRAPIRIIFPVALEGSFHEPSFRDQSQSRKAKKGGGGKDNGLSMERSRFRPRADSSIRKPV